jgi:hypothetical protein
MLSNSHQHQNEIIQRELLEFLCHLGTPQQCDQWKSLANSNISLADFKAKARALFQEPPKQVYNNVIEIARGLISDRVINRRPGVRQLRDDSEFQSWSRICDCLPQREGSTVSGDLLKPAETLIQSITYQQLLASIRKQFAHSTNDRMTAAINTWRPLNRPACTSHHLEGFDHDLEALKTIIRYQSSEITALEPEVERLSSDGALAQCADGMLAEFERNLVQPSDLKTQMESTHSVSQSSGSQLLALEAENAALQNRLHLLTRESDEKDNEIKRLTARSAAAEACRSALCEIVNLYSSMFDPPFSSDHLEPSVLQCLEQSRPDCQDDTRQDLAVNVEKWRSATRASVLLHIRKFDESRSAFSPVFRRYAMLSHQAETEFAAEVIAQLGKIQDLISNGDTDAPPINLGHVEENLVKSVVDLERVLQDGMPNQNESARQNRPTQAVKDIREAFSEVRSIFQQIGEIHHEAMKKAGLIDSCIGQINSKLCAFLELSAQDRKRLVDDLCSAVPWIPEIEWAEPREWKRGTIRQHAQRRVRIQFPEYALDLSVFGRVSDCGRGRSDVQQTKPTILSRVSGTMRRLLRLSNSGVA